MEKDKEMEEWEKTAIKIAQINYADAGKTSTRVLITVLVGLFAISTVFESNPMLILIPLFFFSLAIILYIINQMRRMKFNYEYIKGINKKVYEEREIMRYTKQFQCISFGSMFVPLYL